MPISVARELRQAGHEAWTAQEAHLDDVEDDHLIAYAEDKRAIVVTINRDCAQLARKMRSARLVWLRVREVDAVHAVGVALGWLGANKLPNGMVVRVQKTVPPVLLPPTLPKGPEQR